MCLPILGMSNNLELYLFYFQYLCIFQTLKHKQNKQDYKKINIPKVWACYTYFVIELSKMIRNCFSEFWYMMLTLLNSTIRKYSIEPLAATALNSSRATIIFFSVSAATINLAFTSSEVVLVTCRTSIRASSSTKEP